MSKILVVEPHKILQRAIAVSFFPEHEVQITSSLPEMSSVESFDIVVIDAGALRERISVGELNRSVMNWRTPTVWLDETVSLVVPSRQNLVVLRKPIDKNALLGAFARCQANSMLSTETAPARENQLADKAPIESPSSVAQPEEKSERKPARIIELVDVVEEGPAHKRGRRSERKKR